MGVEQQEQAVKFLVAMAHAARGRLHTKYKQAVPLQHGIRTTSRKDEGMHAKQP